MFRPNVRNRTFDWMGEKIAPVIDPEHFLGHSPFDFPWHRKSPPANLKQENELLVLELAIPGYHKDEISIRVRDNLLIVEGRKKTARRETQSTYILKEFDWDSFERRFELAHNIGHERIEAHYENGILQLTFIDVPAEMEQSYQTVEVK